MNDAHGLEIATDSPAAIEAFDRWSEGFLRYRADLPQRLQALMQAAPDVALAHCIQGYMMMLGYKAALLPVARAAEAKARALAPQATARERLHIEALAAWIDDDLDRAIAHWETILRAHPHDVLAVRLSHFVNFWLGRPQDMLASIERVVPHYSAAQPGYATVLACRCFANEECGNYAAAEPDGRRAIEIDPGNLWAAHSVAHVLEMQGRRQEGIQWLNALAPNWEGANNLQHHLWWHCALYHLENGAHDTVLNLYDTRFRNLASPLTQAAPDTYIDVQNAASMLYRLVRQGVDVGRRWEELADLAETRIGDTQSAFTLPHWMMALAATGRHDAAQRMIDGMRATTNRAGTTAGIVATYALPVSDAVRLHAQGDHNAAVERMLPVIGGMFRMGGSHAQQDVLEQFFLEAATAAGRTDAIRLLAERMAARRPIPLTRYAAWRDAAHILAA
jgi:tetratricopeptide (TPR) repeat protein